MKQPFRRAVSIVCAFTLAVSLVPSVALADGGGEPRANAEIASVDEGLFVQDAAPDFKSVDSGTVAVSELLEPMPMGFDGGIAPQSEDAFSLPLKEGNFERWIDRIEPNGVPIASAYARLEESCDNDGASDWLIEDKYLTGDVQSDGYFMTIKDVSGKLWPTIVVFYTTPQSEEQEEWLEAVCPTYTYAVWSAFYEDHPEVFWMNGLVHYVRFENTRSDGQKVILYGIVLGEEVRSSLYPDEDAVKDGIALRDDRVEEILTEAPAANDPEGRIRYFNEWLTKNNEYNTTEDLDTLFANGIYQDAWECISALEGRSGERGPVCAAYARAFKVLCDQSDIPCVLVNGIAFGPSGPLGGHMWNYVELGENWYGVDVTWNDPTGVSGALSGKETDAYLLIGANTQYHFRNEDGSIASLSFSDMHPVRNSLITGYAFPNGPELSAEKYVRDCGKMGHVYGEKTIQNEKAPTCEADGSYDEVQTCKYCPYEEINVVVSGKATGHEFGDWTVSKNATCEITGEKVRACANEGCARTEKQKIDALGHDMGAWETIQSATCTVPGSEQRRCTRAGCARSETRATAATGHAFGAYRPNGDAKVGVNGTETATCSKCGSKTTRTAAGSALAPAVGQTVSAGGAFFAVTGAATVTYAGPTSKAATSATVPATVEVSGRTYKVTSISAKAFAGNKKLKSVKIGANVTTIPASTFKGCTKLAKVSFGANVKTVGSKAFYGCKSLTSVTLGSKVTSIGTSAFQNCSKLAKVTVKSKSLKSIGKNVFAGCKKLKAVTLKTTKLKSVGKNALKGTAKKLTVKVPKAKVRAYQKLFKSKGSKTVRVKK